MKPFVMRIVAMMRVWGADRCLTTSAIALAILLLVQGARLALTGTMAWGLAQSLEDSAAAPPRRDVAKTLSEYDSIFESGVLGEAPSKGSGAAAPQLFGILGSSALMGTDVKEAKPYDVGTEIPGGETIVEVGSDNVVLEKDGERRTLYVFPAIDAKYRPSGPQTDKPKEAPAEAQAAAEELTPESGEPPALIPPEPVIKAPPKNAFAGSRWQTPFGMVQLQADGRLIVEGQDIGTWEVDGDTISVNAMGEEQELEIRDGVIYVEGEALTRIE